MALKFSGSDWIPSSRKECIKNVPSLYIDDVNVDKPQTSTNAVLEDLSCIYTMEKLYNLMTS